MSEIIELYRKDDERSSIIKVAAVNENREELSSGRFVFLDTSYSNTKIKTMLAGGIGTPVHNRRGGNVRKIFDYMHAKATEEDVAVALLHPFSYAYYRMFGYEKVSDHLIVRFPTRLVDFVPRRCKFVPYDESKYSDLVKIYDKFSVGRNLLLPRNDPKYYLNDKRTVYVCYDGEEPIAYIIYSSAQKLIVNHLAEGLLTVHELAYTSPEALREIFSFLRMFEGEFDDIEFSNIAMCPEVELLLRHYTHTTYTRVPDIMARVINTEKLLAAKTYPEQEGEFTVRVDDILPKAAGVYKVCYGGGDSKVVRLEDSAESDITLSSGAFSRLVYGYDGIDENAALYMDGVTVNKKCTDFFRAFPKAPCGAFEHF